MDVRQWWKSQEVKSPQAPSGPCFSRWTSGTVARVWARQTVELAEIYRLPNEGPGDVLLPTAHCERTTRLCIYWLWRAAAMSLRGCSTSANQERPNAHALDGPPAQCEMARREQGTGARRAREWILCRTLGTTWDVW